MSSGKELVLLDVGFGDRLRPKNIGVRLLSQLSDTCCSGSRKVQGLDMIAQEDCFFVRHSYSQGKFSSKRPEPQYR